MSDKHDHHDHEHGHAHPPGYRHPLQPDADDTLTYPRRLEIAVRELLIEKGILSADVRAAVEEMDGHTPENARESSRGRGWTRNSGSSYWPTQARRARHSATSWTRRRSSRPWKTRPGCTT